MNDEFLYYNGNTKRYYYVGNPVCSVCGNICSDLVRILIFRNKKQSSLNILCMNTKCANKTISNDVFNSVVEHTKAIVSDEIPQGSIYIPFNRKLELEQGRYENTFIAADFKKNELCKIKDRAYRSKCAEFSLEGASIPKPKQIDSNNNISYAELLDQEKEYIERHELSKMISNIRDKQETARLESIARLEEKEKQVFLK